MSIDNISHPPLRHIASFTGSGTFEVPEQTTKVYVSVLGANANGPAASIGIAQGYVNVVPGKSATVVVGAAGGTGVGGTTSFSGAVTVTGGGPGGSDFRYGPYAGSSGVGSAQTGAPYGAPAGALARVTGSATSTTASPAGTSGIVHVWG